MDDDWEYDGEPCPKCGSHDTRWQRCGHCDDGIIDDLYDSDPLWYDEDDIEICHECQGRGSFRWCAKCGADLNAIPANNASSAHLRDGE